MKSQRHAVKPPRSKGSAISTAISVKSLHGKKGELTLFGNLLGTDVETVGIVKARSGMPELIMQATDSDKVYLIRNARRKSGDSSALLINPKTLQKRLEASRRPRRTLGDIVDSLPFRPSTLPPVTVMALPDDEMPVLQVDTRGLGGDER